MDIERAKGKLYLWWEQSELSWLCPLQSTAQLSWEPQDLLTSLVPVGTGLDLLEKRQRRVPLVPSVSP